jgi:phosphopantothenoylcysteine decarboxylase/phosphopantothenate--cysteine ligase
VGRFEGKRILVGITGSVAAVKGALLVSRLVKEGAEVYSAMTTSAKKFVTPLTLRSLSGKIPIIGDEHPDFVRAVHIEAARWADIIVVAPATANTMAKCAVGITDNVLTDIVLAFEGPVVFVPAMNRSMLDNALTIKNIKQLEALGYTVVPTDSGSLACGERGSGRFPEQEKILDYIQKAMLDKPLLGRRVIVSAGPTRHFIDDVRFISNPSSGKMGYEMARWAWMLGADVIFVMGRGSRVSPPHFASEVYHFDTVEELTGILEHLGQEADMLVMTAAVGDFAPDQRLSGKLPREGELILKLRKTKDVVAGFKRLYPHVYTVAFAAEASSDIERALRKMHDKGVDAIVYNDVSKEGIGFSADENEVVVLFKSGKRTHIGRSSKFDIAGKIWREVIADVSKGED